MVPHIGRTPELHTQPGTNPLHTYTSAQHVPPFQVEQQQSTRSQRASRRIGVSIPPTPPA